MFSSLASAAPPSPPPSSSSSSSSSCAGSFSISDVVCWTPALMLKALNSAVTERNSDMLMQFIQRIADQDCSAEIHLLCAEAAVERFHSSDPPKNALYCRALLAQARMQHAQAIQAKLSGNPLSDAITRSLRFVLQALDLSYSHMLHSSNDLIRRISRTYWSVCRPLLLEGKRNQVRDSMQIVTDAYCKHMQSPAPSTADPITLHDKLWAIELLIGLSQAHDEAGFTHAASASLVSAVEMAKSLADPLLVPPNTRRRIIKQLIHFNRISNKVDVAKIAPPSWLGYGGMKHFMAVQRIRSEIVKKENVAKEIADILESGSKPSKKQPAAKGSPNSSLSSSSSASPGFAADDHKGKAEYADTLTAIAEAGRCAAQHGLIELTRAAIKKSAALQMHAAGITEVSILNDLSRAELAIYAFAQSEDAEKQRRELKPDGSSCIAHGTYTIGDIKSRSQAVKFLESAMTGAVHLKNAELIEEGAALAWNVSLPLLQSNLVHKVERLLRICAAGLELIDSLRVELRVLLHLELAKADANGDFVSQATTHLEALSRMDYTIPLHKLPPNVRALPTFASESTPSARSASDGKQSRNTSVPAAS